MRIYFRVLAVFIWILAVGFWGCGCGSSGPVEEVQATKETSRIDGLTHEVASDIVQGIKTPIDKARNASEAEGQYMDKIRKSAE